MLIDPEGVRALLFNLKMQFLALPALLRWGAITVAGILLLRHALTVWWERRQARTLGAGARAEALPPSDPFAHPDLDRAADHEAEGRRRGAGE